MDQRIAFLGNFSLAAADQALTGLVSAVSHFRKTATKADLTTIANQVNTVAAAKVDAAEKVEGKNGLKAQIEHLQSDRAQALTALGILKGKRDTATNDADKADIERRAGAVAHQLDVIDKELDRDRTSLTQAQEWLGRVGKALDDAAETLATAKRDIEDATRNADMARQDRQIAEDQASREKAIAGFGDAASGVSVVLNSLNAQADRDNRAAAIARESGHAIGKASQSGMDIVNDVLKDAAPATKADPFARLEEKAAA